MNISTSSMTSARRSLAAALITTAALMGFAPSAEAAVIASDSFVATGDGAGGTYATGGLYGQNPTATLTGFTGAWSNTNDSGTTDIVAQSSGLSHGLVAGSTGAGAISTAGATAVRSVFRELSAVPESGAYYASFLMESNGNRRGSLGLREEAERDTAVTDSSGGISVGFWGSNGIQAWVNGSSTTILSDYALNTTYFVFIEILDNGSGTNDTVNIRLYSSGNVDLESPDASVSITDQDITGTMTHLAVMKDWGNSNAEHATFDEFRFGTTLDSVVVPEPGLLGLLGIGGVLVFGRRSRRELPARYP